MRYSGFRTPSILDRMQSSTSSPFGFATNSKYGCSYLASSSVTISSVVISAVLPEKHDGEPADQRQSACNGKHRDGPSKHIEDNGHEAILSTDIQRSSIGQSAHLGFRASHTARP